MQPTFRTDLTCSREEQQGVVFFRIDDAATNTTFRLYEIEYLIAQKLDGQRSLQQVIDAVKMEYNFDITPADLEKFIAQLESMGFVQTTSQPPFQEVVATDATREMVRTTSSPSGPP